MLDRLVVRWLLAFGLSFAWLSPSGAEESVKIAFLHVNDVYQVGPIDPNAPRGGLARLSSLVREMKRRLPATLFVFGGDTLSPSVESGLFKGQQMMAAWNAAGVDLAVPGNHEFDFGPEVLRERLAESRFPWLAANLDATPPLPATAPSRLLTLGGVKVGVLGLLTPETVTLSKPGAGIRFAGLLETARREAAVLRQSGAEVVVALTHCTLAEDRELAGSGVVDLILGGHDHHLITELGGHTPIFTAGSDARDVIRVGLRLSRKDTGYHLAGLEWEIIPVDRRWPEDPAVLASNLAFERQLGKLLGETIGETGVALDGRGESLRRGETNLGNFVADAVRTATGSDIALLNGGGFRADRILGPGPLTRRDFMALLPFENPLVGLAIGGAELRTVLEYGLGRRIEAGQSGAMPQVSGLRLTYDPALSPGRRIVSLSVGGQPVDEGKTYRLTTSNYLAGGGDGYPVLAKLPVLRPAEGSPVETEVAIEALRRAGRIAPVVDKRLEVLP